MKALAVLVFVVLLLILFSLSATHAHDGYHNWKNQREQSCCNDKDCEPLAEDNERQTPVGIEVRVEGQWCPVLEHHYLRRGNAPDWSTSHVCVLRHVAGSPCDRLICFQPRPGT